MNDTAIPPADLSINAVRLARIVERLYPGDYMIRLQRPQLKGEAWRIEIFAAGKFMERVIRNETKTDGEEKTGNGE